MDEKEKKYNFYKTIYELENTIFLILLIIGVPILILTIISLGGCSSSNNSCTPRYNRMSQQEKDIYNANIMPYVNHGIKGSEVKEMIDEIISQNQSNVGEEEKFIGIITEKIEDFDGEELKSACEKASIYNSKDSSLLDDGDNNEDNVKEATAKMKELKSYIDTKKNYNIDSLMYQGIYTWIIISKSK